jgi:hypothetical protein
MSKTETPPEQLRKQRMEFVKSLDHFQAAMLLAYISGYRPEAFDEAVKAWAPGRLIPAAEDIPAPVACPEVDPFQGDVCVLEAGHKGAHEMPDGQTFRFADEAGSRA